MLGETAERVPDGGFDVVVMDFDGVCTPSSQEFIADPVGLGPLRAGLSTVVAAMRDHGLQVVLLSNEFDRAWADEIDGFPHFDHIAVGSDNKIFKPDRRAFQRALHLTRCRPEASLVIDDDPTNCRVARSIGCHAIEFDTTDVAGSWATVMATLGLPNEAMRTTSSDER